MHLRKGDYLKFSVAAGQFMHGGRVIEGVVLSTGGEGFPIQPWWTFQSHETGQWIVEPAVRFSMNEITIARHIPGADRWETQWMLDIPNGAHSWARDVGDNFSMHRPRIVCLCGSTRFYKEWQAAYFAETLAHKIVLSVGWYPHASEEVHGQNIGITDAQKVGLDALHLWKIDCADEVLVIDVDGYIGDSTRREIAYATSRHKLLRYRSQEQEAMTHATT